ncbi:helix-turn-helix domain-containing protein [bacterium]|nr:helix-turn-helix domain-containing protein [bacterium]
MATHPETAKARVNGSNLHAQKPTQPEIKEGLPQTVLETHKLLQEGKPLDDIASARGLKQTTIETHLVRVVEEGEELDWRPYLSEDTETALRELFAKHGLSPLRPIMEAAEEGVTYGQLNLMRAVLKREEG